MDELLENIPEPGSRLDQWYDLASNATLVKRAHAHGVSIDNRERGGAMVCPQPRLYITLTDIHRPHPIFVVVGVKDTPIRLLR